MAPLLPLALFLTAWGGAQGLHREPEWPAAGEPTLEFLDEPTGELTADSVAPWVLRPGERLEDFVHTTGELCSSEASCAPAPGPGEDTAAAEVPPVSANRPKDAQEEEGPAIVSVWRSQGHPLREMSDIISGRVKYDPTQPPMATRKATRIEINGTTRIDVNGTNNVTNNATNNVTKKPWWKKKEEPRVAILIVGLLDKWEPHIDFFIKTMVEPYDADVFIHTRDKGVPPLLKLKFGPNLIGADMSDPPKKNEHGDVQWWHLERAWSMMRNWELVHMARYNVVVKARMDMTPKPPSFLDLHEWRQPGHIHMMTDMIFWGQRDDMKKACKYWTSINEYYSKKNSDPWMRLIPVTRLIDTLQRDPWYNRNETRDKWTLYQKLETLPYPNMGERGMMRNLQKALLRGKKAEVLKPIKRSNVHCGDVCFQGDYKQNRLACEKDLLHWILVNNLTICDVGKSVKVLLVKGKQALRRLSSDCEPKLPGFHSKQVTMPTTEPELPFGGIAKQLEKKKNNPFYGIVGKSGKS